MRKSIQKNLSLSITLFGLFLGSFSFASAEIQIGTLGRNSGTHSGTITCPANEKITHFELAFDSSSASRDNVPYDMYINGVKVYNNATPWSGITTLYNAYATTTPVSMSPVDCFGIATWLASSTSSTSEQMRVLYHDINTGSTQVVPSYTFLSPDRYARYSFSGSASTLIIGSKIRFANTPFYLSTSTPSGGGSITFPSTTTVALQNDQLMNFVLMLFIFVVFMGGTILLLRPFYVRK